MSYKKALFGFPIITFLITFSLFYLLSDDTDIHLTTQEYILASTGAALWTATGASILIALWAAIFRYIRHNIASIVLISICISFIYINVAAFFVAHLEGQSFRQWMTHGGFESHLLFAIAMGLYSIFSLPFLLPKARQ